MNEAQREPALAELFIEAGQRHHQAFIESDGFDPEWPLFYSAHVQTRLWDRLGVLLTRSEIVHVMVGADRALARGEETGSWPDVYADRLQRFAAEKQAS